MPWSESITRGGIIAGGAALLWALWRASHPRPLFVVRVVAGRAEAVSGSVTAAFLQRIGEVATANGIERAMIRGFAHGRLIRLHFSKEVSDVARQQLRNWWATFGWGAPHRESPRCA